MIRNRLLNVSATQSIEQLIRGNIANRVNLAKVTGLDFAHFKPEQLPDAPIVVSALVAGKDCILEGILRFGENDINYKFDCPDAVSEDEIEAWTDECWEELSDKVFEALKFEEFCQLLE